MIWILFAIAAGIATWAAIGMRSDAIKRQNGQPILWGAGATAAVLLALGMYIEVQERRTMAQIMDRSADLFDRADAKSDARRAEFDTKRDEFRRDFKERQDAFDRSFKEQGDRFDRAFDEHRAAMGTRGTPRLDGPAPANSTLGP